MENQNSPVKINKYIDVLPMVGNYEIDSFLIGIVGFVCAGLFLNTFLYQVLLILASIIGASFHNNIKHKFVRGHLKHFLYSFGIRKAKKNIPFDQRYFVGG